VLKGKFYLCGTTRPNLPVGLRQDDVRIYDLALQKWKCVATQIKPKGCEGPFIQGYLDQLIHFGGVCHKHESPQSQHASQYKKQKRDTLGMHVCTGCQLLQVIIGQLDPQQHKQSFKWQAVHVHVYSQV